MTKGVKRKRVEHDASTSPKSKLEFSRSPVKRDLLQQYYHCVTTLRQHLIGRLPNDSRLRRKKLGAVGLAPECSKDEACLAKLLDTTLVCSLAAPRYQQQETSRARWQQWLNFSQQGEESYVTISGDPSALTHSLSEIIDFIIWTLFEKHKKSNSWPKHLLCDGFRRATSERDTALPSIPGICSLYPNSQVRIVKEAPWTHVLALLGMSGQRIMIDLLLDCPIFVAVNAGWDNYQQLSGDPLSELDPHNPVSAAADRAEPRVRRPSDITLMRSRIFYAKPALTARGLVQAGLKHIHVLNRCPLVPSPGLHVSSESNDEARKSQHKNTLNSLKVMMYIFPRQFGLHNVFTSVVDPSKTAQKFQDYTLREEEIAPLLQGSTPAGTPRIPKRLREAAQHLVERLQTRHSRCSYFELLRHYCPSAIDSVRNRGAPSQKGKECQSTGSVRNIGRGFSQKNVNSNRHTRKSQPSFPHLARSSLSSITDLACPKTQVSAFCQAAISKVIPDGFWGEGNTMQHNKGIVLHKVDHFIKLRRFETMSLHEVVQDLKVIDVPWLQPPDLACRKTSRTDINKRYEILYEFLYYVFDSFLLPLLRSNFYVTESNTHAHRVFYFRHDVWKRIAEPAMAALKEDMLEEVKLADATSILDSRTLGFSLIRLLPKGKNLRPIMNLRRRMPLRNNPKILGRSINYVLAPIYNFLKLETGLNPSKLGATMFAVPDIYMKLKDFKTELGSSQSGLYFVKVDVQAAFDTIPQDAVVQLMTSIPSREQYAMSRHAEVKPGRRAIANATKTATRPVRRWHTTALEDRDKSSFLKRVERDLGIKKKNTVFIDSAVLKTHATPALIKLMKEHVAQNLVKVGKKFYRQRTGIPQGSVLSSFLCNYFYADLELQHLGFLNSSDCLLLRLIDDFLLITQDREKAARFAGVMHQGLPEYGVKVNPGKTLVNFDLKENGVQVRRLEKGQKFPYCGTLIDCRTLEITKDRQKDKDFSNSLTIDFGRSPGQNFERKVLNAFKIQSHLMYFDTSHNTTSTVLKSIHAACLETADKMCAYFRRLPKAKQPAGTIMKVIDVAFILLTSKSRKMRFEQYACNIRKGQLTLVACNAFKEGLMRKQAKHQAVLAWLEREITRLEHKKRAHNQCCLTRQ